MRHGVYPLSISLLSVSRAPRAGAPARALPLATAQMRPGIHTHTVFKTDKSVLSPSSETRRGGLCIVISTLTRRRVCDPRVPTPVTHDHARLSSLPTYSVYGRQQEAQHTIQQERSPLCSRRRVAYSPPPPAVKCSTSSCSSTERHTERTRRCAQRAVATRPHCWGPPPLVLIAGARR